MSHVAVVFLFAAGSAYSAAYLTLYAAGELPHGALRLAAGILLAAVYWSLLIWLANEGSRAVAKENGAS